MFRLFQEGPQELITEALSQLDVSDLRSLQQVSHRLRLLAGDDHLWLKHFKSRFGFTPKNTNHIYKLFMLLSTLDRLTTAALAEFPRVYRQNKKYYDLLEKLDKYCESDEMLENSAWVHYLKGKHYAICTALKLITGKNNKNTAVFHFEKALDAGLIEAVIPCGRLLSVDNLDMLTIEYEAIWEKLIALSESADNPYALYHLMVMNRFGKFKTRNTYEDREKLLKIGAEKGHIECLLQLGDQFKLIMGEASAINYLEQAAKLKSGEAVYRLGKFFLDKARENVPDSNAHLLTALNWFKEGASFPTHEKTKECYSELQKIYSGDFKATADTAQYLYWSEKANDYISLGKFYLHNNSRSKAQRKSNLKKAENYFSKVKTTYSIAKEYEKLNMLPQMLAWILRGIFNLNNDFDLAINCKWLSELLSEKNPTSPLIDLINNCTKTYSNFYGEICFYDDANNSLKILKLAVPQIYDELGIERENLSRKVRARR